MPYVEQCILFMQSQQEAEYKEQANYTLNAIKKMVAA